MADGGGSRIFSTCDMVDGWIGGLTGRVVGAGRGAKDGGVKVEEAGGDGDDRLGFDFVLSGRKGAGDTLAYAGLEMMGGDCEAPFWHHAGVEADGFFDLVEVSSRLPGTYV